MNDVNIFGNNRKPNGTFIFTDDLGNTSEYHSAQCKHCGVHWQVIPGSGRQRGWCTKCVGVLCGSKRCMECVPQEAQLEIMEGNKKTFMKYKNTDLIQKYSHLPVIGGK